MRRLQSFWGPEVAHFGPLDGPLSMDLEVPFFRLKLGKTSTLTMLSPFSQFWLADLFSKILRYKPLCIGELIDKNELDCIPHIKHTRSSRDKRVNTNGRRLLEAFNNLGGIAPNGSADGDRQGSYSFCGVMGSSVIDYCVCSYSRLHYIKSFTITLITCL